MHKGSKGGKVVNVEMEGCPLGAEEIRHRGEEQQRRIHRFLQRNIGLNRGKKGE